MSRTSFFCLFFFSLISSVIRQICVSCAARKMIEEPRENGRKELVRGDMLTLNTKNTGDWTKWKKKGDSRKTVAQMRQKK